MYNRAITSVRTSEGIISEFPITIELHQEPTLNSYPFVFVMNGITKLIQDNAPWYLLFVDALSLVDETRHKLKVKLENRKISLESNRFRTKT